MQERPSQTKSSAEKGLPVDHEFSAYATYGGVQVAEVCDGSEGHWHDPPGLRGMLPSVSRVKKEAIYISVSVHAVVDGHP